MMRFKGIFTVLLIVIILSGICKADSSFDGLFQRGNEHFAAGDYSSARDVYLTIVNQGGIDASVLYNLGNCQMKLNDIGRAILRYRQAQRIQPHDQDIVSNLNIARSMVSERIESTENKGFVNTLTGIAQKTGSTSLTILTGSSWLLTCLLFVFMLFSRRKRTRRKFVRAVIVSSIIFIFVSGLLVALINEYHWTEYAVAIGDPVIARNGPGDHFTEVYQQQPGYEMKIKRREVGYAEVVLGNGYTAWVPVDSIAII